MGWLLLRRLTGLILAASCLVAQEGNAQTYPSRPIRLIVPFPPGGSADFAARTVAQALSQSLGQPVIVDNRGGADGAIAANAVIASPADGYVLFFATNTPMNAAPALRKVPPYDPVAAFTPISLVCRFGFFLIVHESVPAKTASEFLAYARANPGKLNYGTGNGTSILTTAQLAAAERLEVTHVPYKGDAPAAIDLIAGRIQFSIATLSPAVLPQIQGGHLRVLATLLPHRSPLLPDTPTADEAGLHGMTIKPWGGLFGPAGLPKEVVDRVNSELRAVAARRDVREAFEQVALELQATSPEELSTLLRDQLDAWRRAVKELGVERN